MRASSSPRWRRGATALLVVVLVALQSAAALAQGATPSGDHDRHPQPSRSESRPTIGLTVSIDSMSPAYLTPGEPQTVGGVITNLDDHVWRDLQVYLVMSPSPLTTHEQLVAALDSPATAYSGNRVIDPGEYLNLGSLRPGESASYDLDVPFALLGLLSRAPGVYSIGVHVIATDENGVRNPAEATGRARSFIPLMPRRAVAPVDLSLVWPFQAPVQQTADGGYLNADTLTSEVSSGGQLRRMLDMATAAGDVPISVVLDPGVLDALSHIAADSTCASTSRTDVTGGTPATEQSAPTPSESLEPAPEESPQQQSARYFVRDLLALAKAQTVWTQGFGRPDLTALAAALGTGLRNAVDNATNDSLDEFDLSGQRIYLPTQDVDVEALAEQAPDTVALVSAHQLRNWQLADGPVAPLQTPESSVNVLVADRSLIAGGPAPGPTDTALQVRQRLLSESSLLSLEAAAIGVGDPGIIFVASPSWDPGPSWPSAGFFTAFDAPWLAMTSLADQLAEGPLRPGAGFAPAASAPQSLPVSLLDTAEDIVRRARVLHAVTGDEQTQQTCSDQTAALAVSEYWRTDPSTGEALAQGALGDLGAQLSRITVEGPDFVTLSSNSGRFPITITNGLDRPVSVGVRITADDGSMAFDDIGPVDLRRRESTTFTVRTTASDVGVIGVTATLTTPSGRPFGKPATFSLRTSVVGVIVWIALGAAGALVALAVARRVRRRSGGRRVKGRRTPPLPPPPPLRSAP